MDKRDLKQAGRCETEGNPCHHVDIGIQHRGHDKHRPAKRPYFREPVIRRSLPAEQVTQKRLHRAGIFQKIGIGIGDDVGRNGGRQKQQPFEDTLAGKGVAGDNPRRADPEQDGQDPYTKHQQKRVHHITRQHGLDQMPPQALTVAKGHDPQREDRPEDEKADQNGGDRPAIEMAGRPT